MQRVRQQVAPATVRAVEIPKTRDAILQEFHALPERLPIDAISMWRQLATLEDGRGLRRWVTGRRAREISASIDLINERVRDLSDADLIETFLVFARPDLALTAQVHKYQLPALIDRVGNFTAQQLCRLMPVIAADHRGISRSVFDKFRVAFKFRVSDQTPLVAVLSVTEALAQRDRLDPLIDHLIAFAWTKLARTPKQHCQVASLARKLESSIDFNLAPDALAQWPTDELVTLYAGAGDSLKKVSGQTLVSRPKLAVEEALDILRISEAESSLKTKAEQTIASYLSTPRASSRKLCKILLQTVELVEDDTLAELAMQEILKKKEDFSRTQLIDVVVRRAKELSSSPVFTALGDECLRTPLPLVVDELVKLIKAVPNCPTVVVERLVAVAPRDLKTLVDLGASLAEQFPEPLEAAISDLLRGAPDLKLHVVDKLSTLPCISEAIRVQATGQANAEIAACTCSAQFESLGIRRGMSVAVMQAVLKQAETLDILTDQLVVWAKLGAVPADHTLVFRVLDDWKLQVGNTPHMVSGLADLELPELAGYVADYVLEELAEVEESPAERLVEGVRDFRLFDFDVTAALISRLAEDDLYSPALVAWWRAVQVARPDVARAVRLEMRKISEALDEASSTSV